MMRSKLFSFMALMFFSACLISSGALAQTSNSVTIQNFSFDPNLLAVPVGTTITWMNQDNVPHTVTSFNGTFDSGYVMPGGQFNYTFNQPGNYSYYCRIHAYMFGQIQVTQGSAGLRIMSADPGSDPDQTTVSASSSVSSQFSFYSQFYSSTGGAAPKTHITPPKNYPIKNLGTTFVYF